jgi:hypothetical protein
MGTRSNKAIAKDKPDYVVGGVMRCGDCGEEIGLGVNGARCKNAKCIRNNPRRHV